MTFALYLKSFGFATSVLAAGLLAASMVTGVTQEAFEVAARTEVYAKRLIESGAALRVIFTIDFAFIAAYIGFFLAWAAHQRDAGADRWALATGLICILATAVLDVMEDGNILAMLRSAELGIALNDPDIKWQMLVSQMKFGLSYIGIALMALTWPKRSAFASIVRFVLVLQLPLGFAIFTIPEPYVSALDLGRALFFIVGPLLLLAAETRAG